MTLIRWTDTAEEDLDTAILYIADESIENALAVDLRVRNRVRLLADFPELGHLGRKSGTRELVIPHDRCVVIYRIADDCVEILRVIHGGQGAAFN